MIDEPWCDCPQAGKCVRDGCLKCCHCGLPRPIKDRKTRQVQSYKERCELKRALKETFETLWRVSRENVSLNDHLTYVQTRCTELKNENRVLKRKLDYLESRVADYPILAVLLNERREESNG